MSFCNSVGIQYDSTSEPPTPSPPKLKRKQNNSVKSTILLQSKLTGGVIKPKPRRKRKITTKNKKYTNKELDYGSILPKKPYKNMQEVLEEIDEEEWLEYNHWYNYQAGG